MANLEYMHTLTALVEDKPGVLSRVAGMFRRRGFNIYSLAVGHSEQPSLSRMTFVVIGDKHVVDQVVKQLYKLIDVVQVNDISAKHIVTIELALIKVTASATTSSEILEIVKPFGARVVDITSDPFIIEITGDEAKIDSLYNLLKPFGVHEMMRTGRIAMVQEENGLEKRKNGLNNETGTT